MLCTLCHQPIPDNHKHVVREKRIYWLCECGNVESVAVIPDGVPASEQPPLDFGETEVGASLLPDQELVN